MERRSHLAMIQTAWLSNSAYSSLRGDVLDVGCGAAPYKRLFASLVDSWTTLDARPVGDICHDFDTPLASLDGRFETILATDCLQYSLDPRAALANFHDWLKPGGTLILSAPSCTPEDNAARWKFTVGGLADLVAEQFTVLDFNGLHGLLRMEGENASMIGEYAPPIPATFNGFIDATDRYYPLFAVCIARKE